MKRFTVTLTQDEYRDFKRCAELISRVAGLFQEDHVSSSAHSDHTRDPWEESIKLALKYQNTVKLPEFLGGGYSVASARRVGAILRKLGWYRHHNGKERYWMRLNPIDKTQPGWEERVDAECADSNGTANPAINADDRDTNVRAGGDWGG